ncbi:MAG: acyl-CoA dehydratase activase [Desulfobaccales bacterium]|nr:acyl-CoA dehydratase activase [Desulfobaccales bacterium]
MFCDRERLGEGARGRRPAYNPPPNPLPQPPKFKIGPEEAGPKAPPSPANLSGWGGGGGGRAGSTYKKGPWPSPHKTFPSALGLDFGSRFVKLVYVKGEGAFGRRKLDTLTFYRDYLARVESRLVIDWQRLGLAHPEALVVTGYGKSLLKGHFPSITEIRAHFLGACRQTSLTHFILLEMGGQDTKVIYIQDGRVFDFLTNDRCAAGTGRYLENMARFLKMPLKEFAALWQEPVDISHTCAIFGESELIGHLLEGVPPARIAAGVNLSVARRALMMVRRYPCRTLIFVGGVARNRAVVQLLKEHSDFQVVVPGQPQFNGALGCCLEALTQLSRSGS